MTKAQIKESDLYLLRIEEARTLLRMGRQRFVNEFIKTGQIPITKIDRRNLIAYSDLKQFLTSRKKTYKEVA